MGNDLDAALILNGKERVERYSDERHPTNLSLG